MEIFSEKFRFYPDVYFSEFCFMRAGVHEAMDELERK